jgi:hypothetical protein
MSESKPTKPRRLRLARLQQPWGALGGARLALDHARRSRSRYAGYVRCWRPMVAAAWAKPCGRSPAPARRRPGGTRAALSMDRLSPHRRSPPESGGRLGVCSQLAADLDPAPGLPPGRPRPSACTTTSSSCRPQPRGPLRCRLLSRLSGSIRSSRSIRPGTPRRQSPIRCGDHGRVRHLVCLA